MTTTQPQWEWSETKKTWDFVGAGSYGYTQDKCHEGNTKIYTEKDGGSLYIGGWNNGAEVTNKMHVIDLTGKEHIYYEIAVAMDDVSKAFLKYTSKCRGWLSMPFPDYGTPDIKTHEQWVGIAGEIKKILKKGTHVLVACTGGHGRSGLFCAIVGNILNKGKDGWDNPVQKIRDLHCSSAVETQAQEQFVYNMLKLSLPLTKVYSTAASKNLMICPICGVSSVYVQDWGMCMGCKNKYSPVAPVVHDLTIHDIDNPIEHKCDSKNCIGIYKADVCGHVVHDMIVSDGLCEICSWTSAQTGKKEEKPVITDSNEFGECAMCGRKSYYGKSYGICYDCSEELKQAGAVDSIHNSITDPYRAVSHKCEASVTCTGIVSADVCKHVVHNLEVEDGLCEECVKQKKIYQSKMM